MPTCRFKGCNSDTSGPGAKEAMKRHVAKKHSVAAVVRKVAKKVAKK